MFLPLLFIVTAGCFFLFVLATLFLPVEDHTDEPRFAWGVSTSWKLFEKVLS
jgi:hypothetical protein